MLDSEIIYSVYGQSGVLWRRNNVTTPKRTDYIRIAGPTIARIVNSAVVTFPQEHLVLRSIWAPL